ncbi:MAG: hypothetical protein IPO52_01820 [Gemmatimonadetes bacterium]|nr:hypothetical protein [Gemmatimonadota bacterium]MBP6443331.1 hypothetical protein [Gemmatimonadales bacterium]MBP6570518.1 hypothetical protein [Gemmatimonadales bacterium]MBP7620094.1 hypothetical protein [Gemmatimonadales bacterium]
MAVGAARPLASQALTPSPSAGCAAIVSLSSSELLERERLATFDRRQRESTAGFWRELGCIRQALDLLGHKGREGALMIAGTSWHQGAINAYLQALRTGPTDSLTLTLLGQIVLDDWYADSLGAVGRALLRGAEGGVLDRDALRGCSTAAFWVGDLPTARGCGEAGLASGRDSTFHQLAVARAAAGAGDTVTTSRAFGAAVRAVRTAEDWELLRWQLQWFLSPVEQARVDSAAGDRRTQMVADLIASRDVRDGRRSGARAVEHFRRLDYATAHFAMQMPKSQRERIRTLPATVIIPDSIADRLRGARIKDGLPGDVYNPNDSFPHSVPARPLREFPRWQVDLDDRGVVYLRYGQPVQRIPRIGKFTMREVWLYVIDDKKLLVHFESEAFTGTLEATRLVTGVLGDYLCDVDVRRCQETTEAVHGRLKPENLETIRGQDREFLATATTKDNNSSQPANQLRVMANAYALWRPSTGQPVTVIPYAVRLSDMATLPGDSLLQPLRVAAQSWDGTAAVRFDSTITRRVRKPSGAGRDVYLTGVMALPGTSALSAWSIVLSQGPDRGGRYYEEQHAPLATGPLVLSDVVLGAPSQKLNWEDGELVLPLVPLQGFNQKEPVALYVQARSAVSRADGVAVEVVIARPSTPGKERKVELTVGFKRALAAGLNELQQEVDISRLDPGEYVLEVAVRHAATGASDRRSARLVVR